MLFFLALVSSLDLRKCQDMRFCKENINGNARLWSISDGSFSTDANEYTATLNLNKIKTNYYLQIYKIANSGFRIRIRLGDQLESYRFPIDHDNVVLDSSTLNKHDEIHYESEDYYETITYSTIELNIYPDPFKIVIKNKEEELMTINGKQLMLIEDGSIAEPETFGEFTETFPHGKTAVGIDITFPVDAYISGLLEGTVPSNIPDTTGEPLRRYALDSYSKYGSVPFVIAHSPLLSLTPAIFMMNPSDSFFKISTSEGKRNIFALHETGFIDLVVFADQLQNVIQQYTNLTGKAKMPPAFALGYHQSKWGYPSQQFVEQVMDNLSSNKIPMDTIWLDIDYLQNSAPFLINKTAFPDIQKLYKKAKDKHQYVVRILDPHMPLDVKPHPQYSECLQKGYFVKNDKGENVIAECWPGRSSWPDFFRSEVREWWAQQFDHYDDEWLDNVFVWNDMNEIAAWGELEGTLQKDAIYDKWETREAHSLYGLMMTASTHQGLMKRGALNISKQNDQKQLKSSSIRRPFILTRSFWAGSQKYAWAWSGDNLGSWDMLKYSIDIAVTAGLNGYPFTGSDIGGFNGGTSPELLARWFQAAAYTQPFFREHCMNTQDFREPYRFINSNPSEYKAMKAAIEDRYKLAGLWYTAARDHVLTSRAPVEPLWALFPGSAHAHDTRLQVVVGRTLMSCPVVEEGVAKVALSKPPGAWFDWKTGERMEDGVIRVSLDSAPAYVRGGTILPVFEDPKETFYETLRGNLTLVVALDKNGKASGKIYLDDQTTFDCDDGEYMLLRFDFTPQSFSVKLEGKKLEMYDGAFIKRLKIYGLEQKMDIDFGKASVRNEDNMVVVDGLHIAVGEDAEFNPKKKGVNIWLIVGIIGGVALLVIVVVTFLFVRRKRHLPKSFKKHRNYANELNSTPLNA